MRQKNGRLIVLVAAVAVAAVALGGVFAYRQGPSGNGSAAAPLSAPTSPATPTPSRTPTPSVTPSTTPSAPQTTSTGPTKIKLNLAKLPKGRAPQIPYLVGREVRGGAGDPTKIPGSGNIHAIARLGSRVLAVVSKGSGTELVKIDYGTVERVPDVTDLVSTDDQTAVAYAATRTTEGGGALEGGIVYAETTESVKSLKLPNSWHVSPLAYLSGKVYFRASATETGSNWKLYEWTPGAAKATEITTVKSPTALSDDGRVAASIGLLNDSGTCSDVTVVATGKKLWRTCDNLLSAFTPDGATAIGRPSYLDGYCDTTVSALDAITGRLVREWSGCFHQSEAEDDQHFLIIADASDGGGEDGYGRRAIIRCDISTGACELATPLSSTSSLRIGD
ncbi:hypothetical protein EV644_10755 [Kribbella orskensis]|uniref:Pyrroloquinoline-quinone binding quinoprotein n=1 Tax=Kribbella orskensis TaxID=2512216 RepID=A0ABY2BKK0_9ACTN|nr:MULTISPECIES: hypothetical protein [Kribbella]TCN39086.1 hypothetical protein EV642_10755 [Kribbella sp. VKM Ac-2500]TCO21733.1 hypothetical protein EV644_10755 [Kribbella orskensis]